MALGLLLAAFLLGNQAEAAPEDMASAQVILREVLRRNEAQPYTVRASLKVFRSNETGPQVSQAELTFVSQSAYGLRLREPAPLAGLEYRFADGAGQLGVPGLNTSYQGLLMPFPVNYFLVPLVGSEAQIAQNYELKLVAGLGWTSKPDDLVIDLVPKHRSEDQSHYPIALVPRRRYWIDSDSRRIYKAAYFWDSHHRAGELYMSDSAFAELNYDGFKPEPGLQRLPVGQSGSYKRLALADAGAAQPASPREWLPLQIPVGFSLKQTESLNYRGIQLRLFTYSDGLAQLTLIRVSKSSEAAVAAFEPELLKLLTELGWHSPYNFYQRNQPREVILAMGELHPVELERVVLSCP